MNNPTCKKAEKAMNAQTQPNSNRMVHDYQDYGLEAALLEGQQVMRSNVTPGHNDPFPVQLHWMLQQTEEAGLSHVVGWSPHGRSFAVRDREYFVENILPVYFNQTKITSFQRQCSLYGFKRITKGPDSGSYYHPKFLRNSKTFARNIVRTKVKNDGPRKAAAPESEPDLYSMPRLPEPISPLNACAVRRPSLCALDQHSEKTPASDQAELNHLPFSRLLSPTSNLRGLARQANADFIHNQLLTKQLIQQQQQQLRLEDVIGRRTCGFPSLLDQTLSSSSQHRRSPSLLPGGGASPSTTSLLNQLLPSPSAHSPFLSSSTCAALTQQSSCLAPTSSDASPNFPQAVSELILRRALVEATRSNLTNGPN